MENTLEKMDREIRLLRQENARLKLEHEGRMKIPEGLPCGQFVYRVEGDQNILFADTNVIHLYGCDDLEDFIDYVGDSFRNMVHPDDLNKAESSINAQTLESGHRHDYLRYRIITKQGDVRYIEDFGHIIYDENGNGYYYVFIVEIGEKEYYNENFNSFAESQIGAMNWKVDNLTGLKNFVAFREELKRDYPLSENKIYTAAVFDIIGLQKINESSGRREGDKLIRSLVQSVYKYMPKDSSLYRGYEAEIIVVCPDMSEKDVLDQIRKTADSCYCQVYYGVATTGEPSSDGGNDGNDGDKKTLLQTIEAARYDLHIKKMLHGGSAIDYISSHHDHKGIEDPSEPEGEQGYRKLVADNQSLENAVRSLRDELGHLKLDNEERIRFEAISNTAMEEALLQNHPSDEIDHFLASIGRSLEVDRIYIFEDDPDGEGTNNTYEWCNENVSPEIDNLQKVPFEAVEWWYGQFKQGKDIHIPDLEAIRDAEPLTYSYLKPQGIHSLIAKRLMHGDRIVGFFGVDNPHLEFMADISSFLDTLSNFLASLIQNRNIYLKSEALHVSELEEKNAALNSALQKAEEASAAKSQFLSSMSHDIRTPLNGIIGMTSIARQHLGEKELVEDCLRKIDVSGEHLLGLINDVLDMAKIESGKMTLFMEELSLEEILDSVSTIVRMQTADKSQDYEVRVHDMICDSVLCDDLRLRQVLLNLLGNSVKFTPEGGRISLVLWQEESSRGSEYVTTHIEVEDTGIGISPEFMDTLFEAFEREDEKVRTKQGTGLGMAITKSIVDAMEGTIEVDSEVNRGTIFYIALDLRKGAGPESADGSGEQEMMSLEGMRILLAEDNDLNAEIATVILEDSGARVTRCEDGALAVECFERSEAGDYDAILMDLRMPNMDGLEATRNIRGLQRTDAQTIPIIAMTADAFADDIEECAKAGMNAHVAKPIDIDLLKRTLVKLSRGV